MSDIEEDMDTHDQGEVDKPRGGSVPVEEEDAREHDDDVSFDDGDVGESEARRRSSVSDAHRDSHASSEHQQHQKPEGKEAHLSDSHEEEVAIKGDSNNTNGDLYAEDFDDKDGAASSRAATPPSPPKASGNSPTPPNNAATSEAAPRRNYTSVASKQPDSGDESDASSSSISSVDSKKNAARKVEKEKEKKLKLQSKERQRRASRVVKVRGGIGTNGNSKDHRPGNIRVISYLRDLSDYEKAYYKEECSIDSGVGAVPIRMRRGVGVEDLGARTPLDGNQTGITRVALVEQGEYAHYRFDDCLWGCKSLREELADPAASTPQSIYEAVGAPLVSRFLRGGTDSADEDGAINATLLVVGAESAGKGTMLFGSVHPQPLSADFEAMRQFQLRTGVVGGRGKTNVGDFGAPQTISYVEKNKRSRAAKEIAAATEASGGDSGAVAKKPATKKAAGKGAKDPRPSTFEELPGGNALAAEDGLVIRTVDALLKGSAGSQRDVFLSFLRLDATRDKLYNLVSPVTDNLDTDASTQKRDSVEMDTLQTLAATLQSQVQCRATTVPVRKSEPALGNITTYSLRGVKPVLVSTVQNAKRLLFAARQRSQINIPESADHKTANEYQEVGGLSDPTATSIVTVIYLIPRSDEAGGPPLQKLIIAGLSTSNTGHAGTSMGQTQLAIGNSLADSVRFGRRGFPEAGYKDITHFRDSTLSQALKECVFGPRAAVTVLGCLAPTTRYVQHSHNTLRFLDRIKTIEIPEEDLDGAVYEADCRIAEEAGSKAPPSPLAPLTHFRILGTLANGQGAAATTSEFDAVLNVRGDEKRNNRGMGGYGLTGEGTSGTVDSANTDTAENVVGDGKKLVARLPGDKRDAPLWKDKYKGPIQIDHKAPTEAIGFVFNNNTGVHTAGTAIGLPNMEPQAARRFLYDTRRVQREEIDRRQDLMHEEKEAFVAMARKDMKDRLRYFRANPKTDMKNPATFAEYERLEAKRKAQKEAEIVLYEERKRANHDDPKKNGDFELLHQGENGGGSDSDNGEVDFEASLKPKRASKKPNAVQAAPGSHPHAKYGFFKDDYRNPTKPSLGETIPSNATIALEKKAEAEKGKPRKPRPFTIPDDKKKKTPVVVDEEPPAPEPKKIVTPRRPVKQPAPPPKASTGGASPRASKGAKAAPKRPAPPVGAKVAASPRASAPPEPVENGDSSSVSPASSRKPSVATSDVDSSRRPSKLSHSSDNGDAQPADEEHQPVPDADEAATEEEVRKETTEEPQEYLIPLSNLHFPNSAEGKRIVEHFGHRAHLVNFRMEGDTLPDGRRASHIETKAEKEAEPVRLYMPELTEDREELRNNRAAIYRDFIRATQTAVPEEGGNVNDVPVAMFTNVMRGINVELYRLYKEQEDADAGRKKPELITRARPSELLLEVPLILSCLAGGDEVEVFSPELLAPGHAKMATFIQGVFGESCSLVSSARKAYQYVLRNDDPPNPASPGDKTMRWSRFRQFCVFIGGYYETLTEVCGVMRDVSSVLRGKLPLFSSDDLDQCLSAMPSSELIPAGCALSYLNTSVSDEVVARMVAYGYQYQQVSECAFRYYFEAFPTGQEAVSAGVTNKHHDRNNKVIAPGIAALHKWCAEHWDLDDTQIRKRLQTQNKPIPEKEGRLVIHNGVVVNPFYVAEWLVRKVINRIELEEELAGGNNISTAAEAAWVSRANEVAPMTDDEDLDLPEEDEEEYEEEEVTDEEDK